MLMSMDREILQIIGVTLRMSFFSTTISCLIGMPLGVLMTSTSFRGKRTVKKIINTLMGLPPVVAGLIVYMLFTKYGVFGSLGLLFTVEAMVIEDTISASVLEDVVKVEETPVTEEKHAPTSFTDMKSALDAIRARLKK